MKFKSILHLLSAILVFAALAGLPASAQTNTADTGFFGTVAGYFTSFNPELEGVLDTHKGTFWSGAQWQEGAHVSSSMGLSYEVYKHIEVESETRFADVTGTVFSQQVGLGHNVNIHDVQLTGAVRGGYYFESEQWSGSLEVRAQKLMTTHTAALISLEIPFEKAAHPIITIGMAIRF